MDYRTKIMAYADVLQLFADEDRRMFNTLQEKISAYNQDPDRQQFWSEVLGRMMRNVYYQEIREMTILERKYSHVVESAPDTVALVKSPTLLTWIELLKQFDESIDFLSNYQYENTILESPSEQQSMNACLNSLAFLNYAIEDGKSMSELFRYIPLTIWSLDALLITKQYHREFDDFCKLSFIPIMRAHQKALLEFMELVNNEEKYLDQEGKVLEQSSIFDRSYQAEELDFKVPPNKTSDNPDEWDKYLVGVAYTINEMIDTNKFVGERVETEKRNWRLAPMSHLTRLRIHSDMLGVTDEYIPVMSPKLLKEADDYLYTHTSVYTERSLIESSVLALENVNQESLAFENKSMFYSRYSILLETLEENLQDMLKLGLITGPKVRETVDRMKARGELHGIYRPSSSLEQ